MAHNFGKIESFSGRNDDWELYVERLEIYFTANDLAEIPLAQDGSNAGLVQKRAEKRRAILLSAIGAETYSLLRNLVAPQKPSDISYTDLVSALKNHYQPTCSVTVERYKFHTRSKKPSESVPEFVSELKKLADKCAFGETLNDMLKDRLVAGINDEKIQKRLLVEPELTFEKAYNISVSQELASKDVHVLHSPHFVTSNSSVHKISSASKNMQFSKQNSKPSKDSSSKKCFRCNDTSHLAPKCRFINAKCRFCGKIGHIERACLSKKKRQNAKGGKQEHANMVDNTPESGIDDFSSLFCVNSTGSASPFEVNVLVDKVPLTFQLDTGAGVSLINKSDFIKSFGNVPLSLSSTKLRSYSGDKITVVGEKLVNVSIGDQSANLTLLIVEGNGPPLLGRTWL